MLIDILDIAGKRPCADVRVDEVERLKVNVCKFLEYFLPTHSWDNFGGKRRPIEIVLDDIVACLTKAKALTALLQGRHYVVSGSSQTLLTAGVATFNNSCVQQESTSCKLGYIPCKRTNFIATQSTEGMS